MHCGCPHRFGTQYRERYPGFRCDGGERNRQRGDEIFNSPTKAVGIADAAHLGVLPSNDAAAEFSPIA
jgi:hypothetical protein